MNCKQGNDMNRTEEEFDDTNYDKAMLDQISAIFQPVNNDKCIRIPKGIVHKIKTASAYETKKEDELWDTLISSQEKLKKYADIHIHKNRFNDWFNALRDDIGKECLDDLQERAKSILPIDNTGIWNYYL